MTIHLMFLILCYVLAWASAFFIIKLCLNEASRKKSLLDLVCVPGYAFSAMISFISMYVHYKLYWQHFIPYESYLEYIAPIVFLVICVLAPIFVSFKLFYETENKQIASSS